MSARANEIADDIAKVLSVEDSLDDVISALFDCMTVGLAQLCPDCRAMITKAIIDQLPHAVERSATDMGPPEPPFGPRQHPRFH